MEFSPKSPTTLFFFGFSLVATGCYTGVSTSAEADEPESVDTIGSTGFDEGGSESGDPDVPGGGSSEAEALPSVRMRRLTKTQLVNTLADLTSAEIAASVSIPEDLAVHEWISIGARETFVSPSLVRAYEDIALEVASSARADEAWVAQWVPCPIEELDQACLGAFVTEFGRLAHRRPLSDARRDRYVAIGLEAAQDAGDLAIGLEFAMASILSSVYFTHMPEVGVPDGDRVRHEGAEFATRLSYALWASPPDAELLDVAVSGGLEDPAVFSAQVERMLESDNVERSLDALAEDFFLLHRVEQTRADAERFPLLSNDTLAVMKEATLRMIRHVVLEQGRPLTDVLNADVMFVDPRIAPLFPDVAPSEDWQLVELPQTSERVGLLTEPGFLVMDSNEDSTSPTRRGKFVRSRLLCVEVPPPPPDIVDSLPLPEPGQTRREQLAVHMEAPDCAACHEFMDPIGFGLENFDADGRYRLLEGDVPVDATGALDGVSFDDGRSLSAAVAENPRLNDCFSEQLFRFFHGTEYEASMDSTREALLKGLEANMGFRELLRVVAHSEALRYSELE